jgi:hypothetical protein
MPACAPGHLAASVSYDATGARVEKRSLIYGQERLTTIVLLLALIRERALAAGNARFAEMDRCWTGTRRK